MNTNTIQPLFKEFKHDLIKAKFMGGIDDDLANLVLNSTDNSIYELTPLGVITPKNHHDVKLLSTVASNSKYHSLTFTARGGGTGTNGQSLTNGVVIDMSRYMNNVLDFNLDEQTVTVEAGVILGNLNKFLSGHGLFFAPNVSTENRATIGGMIANDSAGKGSLVYGKTSDYILELTCVLIDGTVIVIKPLELEQLNEDSTELHILARQIKNLVLPVENEVQNKFPPLKRPLSGYNLKIIENNKIDLTKIISGSEGTLAFVTQAKLKLLIIPKHKALVVTHYNSFLDALDDAGFLIAHKPLAVETVDEVVQKSASLLPQWDSLAKIMGILPTESFISNFTEFVDDDLVSLNNKLNGLEADLINRNIHYAIVNDKSDINQLWNIRSLAVGLVGRVEGGGRKPVAFVEDAIVPPHNLKKFVAEFRTLLDNYSLTYAMYGHSDVGCVHVRPALDLRLDEDKPLIRQITQEVVNLTDKYDGLLWGEHGKGFRGEFVEHTFGKTLYAVLQKIKTLFDPLNRMNPGKLVTPFDSLIQVIKIDDVTLRGELDKGILSELSNKYTESMLCNGNAACFNQDATNVMCPSYKVTQDRKHSPKGRAMLVKDWLRNRSKFGDTHKLTRQSAQVAFKTLEGCLGCKGCAGKCPTLVSIPDLKAKFYHEYYKLYNKNNLKKILFGNLENVLLFGAKFPRLWNILVQSRLSYLFGIIKPPKMSITKSLYQICQDNSLPVFDGMNTEILDKAKNQVVILLDVFVGLLEHNLFLSFSNVLRMLGYSPIIILPTISGKALITYGEIDKFENNAEKIAKLLSPVFNLQIRVVGLENSITLMYRDEFKKYTSDISWGKVYTVAEFLSQCLEQPIFKSSNANNDEYYLLPHCTEQAICPADSKLWQSIFNKINVKCNILNLGCCGMAGNYGHEARNKGNSEQLFKMHWESSIKIYNSQNIMATGYSCRTQAKSMLGVKLNHPVMVLEKLLV